MLLIILLVLVVVFKYLSLKESFLGIKLPCPWEERTNQAINSRNTNKTKYYEEVASRIQARQQIQDKQSEINVNNSDLETALIDAQDKYTEILVENESLTDDLNKTTNNREICENFNKLKLNAIKKIYS